MKKKKIPRILYGSEKLILIGRWIFPSLVWDFRQGLIIKRKVMPRHTGMTILSAQIFGWNIVSTGTVNWSTMQLSIETLVQEIQTQVSQI